MYWSTFYMLAGVRMTLGRVLVIAGMTVAVTGCGGSSTPSGPHAAIRTATSSSGVATSSSNGAAHTAVTPAIKKLVVSWAGADTPQTVCSLMSYSFKFGVGHGQSPAQCTTWITKAFGPFSKSTGKVISASKIAGQISVLVNIGGHVATLYAVQECGGLKINSIGVLNQHKSPPSCA